jgi:ribosome-associated protein
MTQRNDIVELITEGIQERKGRNITYIDLGDIDSAATRTFIICEGTSTMHVAAIADSVREYLLQNAGIKPFNYDGYQNSQWIVIDYGQTYVHVFIPEARDRYNLEELWNDGIITNIPNLD